MPDAIQFHGQETPDQIAQFREMFPPSIEIWKAMGVSETADLATTEAYTAADRFLQDAKPPKGADAAGGHGAPFDWSILKALAKPQALVARWRPHAWECRGRDCCDRCDGG